MVIPGGGGRGGANFGPTIKAGDTDIRPLARLELMNLKTDITRALPRYGNATLKAHLVDALARIDAILNPKG
jgi:hypothetical protein